MKRIRTDFFSTTSSFLTGFGSVLNLSGQVYRYNSSENPDQLALEQDWRMVGQDIREAMESVRGSVAKKSRS